MKNIIIILSAVAVTFFSCKNNDEQKNKIIVEPENTEFTSPEESGRDSTLKVDEKLIVYVEADDEWFKKQKEKYQNKADSVNKIVTDKFIQAITLAKENDIKVIKELNHYNLMFTIKDNTYDLRLEELSASGYKLVLINPDNKFDVLGVKDLDLINEKLGEVFGE